MTWSVEFLAEAEKDMKKLDHSAQIQVLKGIRKVSQNPLSAEEGGYEVKEKYAAEVKEKWGGTKAYEQSQRKTGGYNKEDWKNVSEGMDELLEKFAAMIGEDPDSERVQELVGEWKQYITDTFYDCTNEILAGLGQMYVADERFTRNMDKFKPGTAKLISDGIAVYCK